MKKDYIKYLAAMLLFGSNGLIASHISLTSMQIVFLRSSLGAALLIVLFLLTGHRFTLLKHKKDLLFVAMAGIAMGGSWLCMFEGFTRIGVSLSVMITYVGPAITVLLALVIFKEKLTLPKTIALVAALVGAILVNGVAMGDGIEPIGLVIAGMSAVCYAVMIICNKCAKETAGMEVSVVQLFFTAVTVSVYLAVRSGFSMSIEANIWPWILWLGLINTGMGCFLCFSSTGALPVQSVAILGYLEPLSAVAFSMIFLSERLTPLQWCGVILIIGGAITGELKKTHNT